MRFQIIVFIGTQRYMKILNLHLMLFDNSSNFYQLQF